MQAEGTGGRAQRGVERVPHRGRFARRRVGFASVSVGLALVLVHPQGGKGELFSLGGGGKAEEERREKAEKVNKGHELRPEGSV